MQHVVFSLNTLPARSGHSACYVPDFRADVTDPAHDTTTTTTNANASTNTPSTNKSSTREARPCLVQFGGWPPSKELKAIVRNEGSSCPLYCLELRRVHKALQRTEEKENKRSAKNQDQRHATNAGGRPTEAEREAATAANQFSQQNNNTTSILDMTSSTIPIDSTDTISKYNKVNLVDSANESFKKALQLRKALKKFNTSINSRKNGDPFDKLRPSAASRISMGASASNSSSTEESSSDSSFDAEQHNYYHNYDEGYNSAPSDLESMPSENPSEPSEEDEDANRNDLGNSVGAAVTPVGLEREGARVAVAPVVTAALLDQVQMGAELRQHRHPSVGNGEHSPNPTTAPSESAMTGSRRLLSSAVSAAPFEDSERDEDSENDFLHFGINRSSPNAPRHQLYWERERPLIAPRSRHGHFMLYHRDTIYVIGGCYWAHGDAMATADLAYNIKKNTWRHLPELALPPRFCASMAISNGHHSLSPNYYEHHGINNGEENKKKYHEMNEEGEEIVFYVFGGSDFNRQLTNTLFRCVLPSLRCEELPQLGSQPRPQFKGVLVCDVQLERGAHYLAEAQLEETSGSLDSFTTTNSVWRDSRQLIYTRGVGQLYYMDGYQEGKPMAPALRQYTLLSCVWRKVSTSPDLVRSQLSYVEYSFCQVRLTTKSKIMVLRDSHLEKVNLNEIHGDMSDEKVLLLPATQLVRFDVFGGMPSRRGRQRRTRRSYSFDVLQICYDYNYNFSHHQLQLRRLQQVQRIAPLLGSSGTNGNVKKKNLFSLIATVHAGLTAHCVVLLPVPGHHPCLPFPEEFPSAFFSSPHRARNGNAIRVFAKFYETTNALAISCGGNEDNAVEKSGSNNNRNSNTASTQNSLGEPVGRVYFFAPRPLGLKELMKVFMDKYKFPYKLISMEKDSLLDELF